MALLGPFALGQTIRLGNHTSSDRTPVVDEGGTPTTPASATLTVWTPDPAAPGFRTSGTYGYPDPGTLGTLVLEEVGRLYVDVVPVAGESGRWACTLAAVGPTCADGWELVVEEPPT